MSPENATQLQIQRYRQLTPAARIKLGLELHELACKMSMVGIKQQFPNATDAERQRELTRRLETARC